VELHIGSMVEDYCVEGLIAEGGMSLVYLVRHTKTGTLHALKVLQHQSKSIRARLQQEGRLQRLLIHPNVVPVSEVITVGHTPALVMDYVAGPDLAELIAIKRLSERQVDAIATGILRALIAAHANGMIHRDLKPSNILMAIGEEELTPRITDFGLAKVLDADEDKQLTRSGVVMGTPSYMAPEQIWDARSVDARADIFSVGVILYELLSGTRAFEGQHSVAIWAKITSGAFVPLSVLRPDLPISMIQVVHRAMAIDQAQRTPDAEALLKRWTDAYGQWSGPQESPVWDQDVRTLANNLADERREKMGVLRDQDAASEIDLATTIAPFLIDPEVSTQHQQRQVNSHLAPRYAIKNDASQHPGNLPTQVDRFIGRSKELIQLKEIMQSDRPILTLAGPGGMGKTRLSLAFAERHRSDFPGGVWFCDLTEAQSAEDIIRHLATTLQIPLSEKNPAMQLAHAIDGRGSLLIVLDNMEQVVKHAKDTVGMWARHAPAARFVVTSRIRLGLQSERIQILGPIDPEDGIALFEERACDHNAAFVLSQTDRAVVGEIVSCLDGMCLAIELAAARSALLTPTQILERLGERFKLLRGSDQDRPARQATLMGAIDWSWDLLCEVDRAALSQCSIFRGGFTLSAAEAVLDLEPFSDWVLDVLQSLVNQSLLRITEPIPGSTRFHMYESIREYALKKMCTPGSIGVHEGEDLTGRSALKALTYRHSAFFAQLGDPERIDVQFWGGDAHARAAYRIESDNLLHAMAISQGTPHGDIQGFSTLALATIHRCFGPFAPALSWILTALQRDDISPRCRFYLTAEAAHLYWALAQIDAAVKAASEALEIAQILKDPVIEAMALSYLAEFDQTGRPISQRIEMLNRAHQMIQGAGAPQAESQILLALGGVRLRTSDVEQARAYAQAALKLSQTLGSDYLQARALRCLAGTCMELGKPTLADKYLTDSLDLARRLEQPGMIVKIYTWLGTVYKGMGRLEASVQAHEDGIEIARQIGAVRDECILLGNLALILQLQGKLDDAQMLYEDTLALTEATGTATVGHMAHGNLGDLLLGQGKLQTAIEHLKIAIAEMDSYQEITAGAFRGSLAWACAQLGDFKAAETLLNAGEAQLKNVWMYEHGRLLCRRAQVLYIQGNPADAHVALQAAKDIAQAHGGSAQSDLGQLITEAEGTLAG
jgi:predicted ATPase/Tfp pilus assembly protein PilF